MEMMMEEARKMGTWLDMGTGKKGGEARRVRTGMR